jgi:hypothetical protein
MARVIIAAALVSVAANLAVIDSITAFAEEPKAGARANLAGESSP